MKLTKWIRVLSVAALLLAAPALAQEHTHAPAPDVEAVKLSPTVARLLDDQATPEAERRALAIFHGQWDRLQDLTIAEQAFVAWLRYDLHHPSLQDAAAPVLLRARAALARGEPEQTLSLLEGQSAAQALLVRAQALEQVGRAADAIPLLAPLRQRLQQERIDDAAELTAAGEALVLLAQLEGRPARDYEMAIATFGRARDELDRLYWPAYVAEARLLAEKDNIPEAVNAAFDALKLNPRSSEVWQLLGAIAAHGYNFDKAVESIERLQAVNSEHLLAEVVRVQMLLTQRDVTAARAVLDKALARYPQQRTLLALSAATEALLYRPQGVQQALARFAELSPGNPTAHFTTGFYLSKARQYSESQTMLQQALAMQPNWAEASIELGLLLMQSGDEEQARTVLRRAVDLDPFNRRAGNQLKLVEELLGYEQIRTEHFLIKYRAGIDAVLARDMPEELERIYRDITGVFRHKPARTTLIEVLPDSDAFGVRITGIPEIWTIGAATGDVIAITPPRLGSRQRGSFDWARVIRHEFVHTVTLDQTANRIPHWFTEACAVWQEPGGRDYDTCRLLASALHADKLFGLADINWGFVRPKTPHDRPLAYAQAHWMLEFIVERFGHDAVVRLLALFRQGVSDQEAIPRATSLSPEQFMAQFKGSAAAQVRAWGLDTRERDAALAPALRQMAGLPEDHPAPLRRVLAEYAAQDPQRVEALLKLDPEHPDLLEIKARQTMETGDAEAARQAVMRYAAARPVDPWPHMALAQLGLRSGRTQEVVASLEQLDQQEQKTGDWSYQLAELYRNASNLDAAATSVARALHREPYNPKYRELAATIDLQRGQTQRALRHLEAMPLLEPDRAVHHVRLAALYTRLNQPEKARAAAEQARKLDPRAAVGQFLGE